MSIFHLLHLLLLRVLVGSWLSYYIIGFLLFLRHLNIFSAAFIICVNKLNYRMKCKKACACIYCTNWYIQPTVTEMHTHWRADTFAHYTLLDLASSLWPIIVASRDKIIIKHSFIRMAGKPLCSCLRSCNNTPTSTYSWCEIKPISCFPKAEPASCVKGRGGECSSNAPISSRMRCTACQRKTTSIFKWECAGESVTPPPVFTPHTHTHTPHPHWIKVFVAVYETIGLKWTSSRTAAQSHAWLYK